MICFDAFNFETLENLYLRSITTSTDTSTFIKSSIWKKYFGILSAFVSQKHFSKFDPYEKKL